MANLDKNAKAIGKGNLKLLLPQPGALTVASAAVGQYEQMISFGIFD